MQRARSAYTLLEVILVMALLAIIAALAVPSIDAMMAQNRLNASVDQVRAAWSMARARALEEGLSYRFSIQPGENSSYRIAPDNEAFTGNGSGTSPASDEVSTPPLILEENSKKESVSPYMTRRCPVIHRPMAAATAARRRRPAIPTRTAGLAWRSSYRTGPAGRM